MANYGSYAPYGPLAAERNQHIDELFLHYPTAKAINPDRSVWDLPLELRDKKTTALRISLTPHFPQERPILSVLVPVAHPSVDSTGRVHTPQLSCWVYGSSKLVTVVAEAVAALSAGVADNRQVAGGPAGTVPYPAGYPTGAGRAFRPGGGSAGALNAAGGSSGAGPGGNGSPRVNGTGSTGSSSSSLAAMAGAGGPLAGPATSSRLPDFSRYSAQQLEELMADDSKFKELLREAVAGSSMNSTLEEIRVSNRQLAEANMSRQDVINEVRNQLAVVRSSEYTLIRSRFDALLERQRAVVGALSPAVWKEALEDAVCEADAASSTLANSFLGGEVALDEFLRQYVESRSRHHVLDLKRQAADTLLAPPGPAAAAGGLPGGGVM